MGATERLRELLDEHGIKHYDGTERTLWGYEQTGEGTGIYRFAASEINDGFLQFDMFRISPEQAIAATLERGTSKAVSMRERDGRPYLKDELVCAKCGCPLTHEFGHVWQNFCPNCGAELMK